MSHQTDFEHARIRLKRAIDLIHRLDVIERQLPPVRCLAFLRDLQPAATEYVEKLRQFRPDVWEWIQGQSHSDPALAVLVAITELPQPEVRDAWPWIVGQSLGDADLAVPVAATPSPQVEKLSVVAHGTAVMLLFDESAQSGHCADDLLAAFDKVDQWINDHGIKPLSDEAWLSPRDVANQVTSLSFYAVEGRLRRYRAQNDDCWKEVTDRKPREAQYLYQWGKVKQLF